MTSWKKTRISCLIIIVSLVLVCLGDMVCHYIRLQNFNQSPLSIMTYDGSNSPYHPSVIYSPQSWGGYHYMMSETPFFFGLPSVGDNYRDQFENPSIHLSVDGIHWTSCQAPIDSLTYKQIQDRDYFSDPDLLVSPLGVECWYRLNRRYGEETNQNNIVLYRRITKNGYDWSNPQMIADLEHGDLSEELGNTVISQTLLFENNKYKMWFYSGGGFDHGTISYSESDTTLTSWSNKKTVNLCGPKVAPWHLHIMKDENFYWLTIYDHKKDITLWKSKDEVAFEYVSTPVKNSGVIGSFYSHDLYRACLLKLPSGGYRLYFSADDGTISSIGVMEGATPEKLQMISVDGKEYCDLPAFLNTYFRTRWNYISKRSKYYSQRIRQIIGNKK